MKEWLRYKNTKRLFLDDILPSTYKIKRGQSNRFTEKTKKQLIISPAHIKKSSITILMQWDVRINQRILKKYP